MAIFPSPPPFGNPCCELVFGFSKSRTKRNILYHRPKMSPLCSCRIAPKQFKDTFWLCGWQKEQLGELQWGRQTEFWKKGVRAHCVSSLLRLCFNHRCFVYIEHLQAKVGSNLKSVQHDHESLRELINENIVGDQIALQIDSQFSSKY